MAGVRDPAFWKRFSVAVHMDEEQGEKLGPQYKDQCVNQSTKTRTCTLRSKFLRSSLLMLQPSQRLMARPPKQQKEEPHRGLLVLLDILPRHRRRCRRRHHLVGREWDFR